jgi:hypothetical protein
MSSTAPKRTPAQRSQDLLQIERWNRRGKTGRQITELLNAERPYQLTRQQIVHDLKKLDRMWQAEAVALIDSEKRRLLQALKDQEDQLWTAWEKSKEDATRATASKESGGGGDAKERNSITKQGQCGDGIYMRLLLDNWDRRAKLLGLDEPTKTELSGTVGQVIFELPDNGRDPIDGKD